MNDSSLSRTLTNTQAECLCSFCGDPVALPSFRADEQEQRFCAACAADFGKYDQAYMQLDLLIEEAAARWLTLWGHEDFTRDFSEHLSQVGDAIHAAARKRLAL